MKAYVKHNVIRLPSLNWSLTNLPYSHTN
jgi:hypothetical protein